MTFLGPAVAAAAIGVWHAVIWIPIVAILRSVFSKREPHLPARRQTLLSHDDSEESHVHEQGRGQALRSRAWTALDGFTVFFRQPTWPLLLSLALLYFTALSLGLLMTSYLKWRGATWPKLLEVLSWQAP